MIACYIEVRLGKADHPYPSTHHCPRTCFICGAPIAECMGAVLPRDVLLMFDGRWDPMLRPRELCGSLKCGEAWNVMLSEETI